MIKNKPDDCIIQFRTHGWILKEYKLTVEQGLEIIKKYCKRK